MHVRLIEGVMANSDYVGCAKCGETVRVGDRICRHCGQAYEEGIVASLDAPRWSIASFLWIIGIPIVLGVIGSALFPQAFLPAASRPRQAETSAPLFNTPEQMASSSPVEPQRAQESVEYKLATLDREGYVAADDVSVARFRELLRQLSAKYAETPQSLGNMSVKCRNALRDRGISESITNIMEGLNQLADRPGGAQSYGKDPYPSLLTLYVVLRTSGKSHAAAIENLSGVLGELGLK